MRFAIRSGRDDEVRPEAKDSEIEICKQIIDRREQIPSPKNVIGNMDKFLILVGMTIGSSLGWWLGEYEGMWTAIFLSTFFGILGILAGWKFSKTFLE